MLTVFLIREFTLLLAEHCARQKGGQAAARLAPPIRRYIGVGNSTGLGWPRFCQSPLSDPQLDYGS